MAIELLAAAITGMAVLLFALYFSRNRRVRPADTRIRRLVDRPQAARRGVTWEEVRRGGPASLPLLGKLLADSTRAAEAQKKLEQAGLKLRAGEYLMGRAALALAAFILVMIVGSASVLAFVLGLAAGIIAFMLPEAWLSVLRKRRVTQIAKQIPEAVTMIANSLRAGFAFQHGLDMVASQMEPPIADEFGRTIVDMNVGSSVEEALAGLLERADSEDLNMMVTAVLIQRTSGGNLAEILETVGETMRERERLTGEIRTMTAQQRFSGTVLTFWPLAILGLFAMINWDHTSLLFTTDIGLIMLSVGGIGQLLGYYTIRRILDIDI